jgi:outer membrane receptor protein involved in Fe transport
VANNGLTLQLLNGVPRQVTVWATPFEFYENLNQNWAAFVQDDWQIRPSVSLSFGVRYMVATTWKERDNALSNFDATTGKLVIPSDKLPPQGQEKLSHHQWIGSPEYHLG